MFDFPSSPTNGQQYKAPSGQTYVFNGVAWLLSSGPPTTGVVTGDNPPPAPVPGMLWFQSSTGNTYIWYVDVDSSAWVQFNVGPPVVAGFIQRQFIIASGAITLNAATKTFQVEVQGGGGGGGNVAAGAANQGAAGSGGGAGGYVSKWIVRPPDPYAPTCTIGANAGSASNGSATSFTDGTNTLNAGGGTAGVIGYASANGARNGGGGGTAVGGDLNAIGDQGGMGYQIFATPNIIGMCMPGASSRFGAGGAGQVVVQNVAYHNGGTNGNGRGSGGSGAISAHAGAAVGGGIGIAGCVVITEYR